MSRAEGGLAVSAANKDGSAPVRVVIAEDEAISRLDLKETLEEEGYEVVGETGRGDEAVSLVRDLQPDLAILDIKMPGMDGIAAAREIATARKAAVLILTAFSQRDLVQQASEAGVMHYLVKPFQKSALIPAIEVALVVDPHVGRDLGRAQGSDRLLDRGPGAIRHRRRRLLEVEGAAVVVSVGAADLLGPDLAHVRHRPLQELQGLGRVGRLQLAEGPEVDPGLCGQGLQIELQPRLGRAGQDAGGQLDEDAVGAQVGLDAAGTEAARQRADVQGHEAPLVLQVDDSFTSDAARRVRI